MLCRFQTYFPHVDNVYSHRSTQRYKRKPFISHYWDCRLKGRPPGTKKSDDPNKRKRKRNARERDLCDVKIKITEFFEDEAPQFKGPASEENSVPKDLDASFSATDQASNHLNGEGTSNGVQAPQRKRRYVIQRVNGNGANGKTDGVPGPHKHTLAESDRIKKNSIERTMLTKEKVRRKTEVSDDLLFADLPSHASSKQQAVQRHCWVPTTSPMHMCMCVCFQLTFASFTVLIS